ncbi:MAG: hypothetical protein K2L89_03735 [Muribaculaceae bacterium]|nr:hypothetical protein [Muribaculaceae bacterium]
MDEAGYFMVNVIGFMGTNSKGKFSIAVGSSPEIASMENKIEEFVLPTGSPQDENIPETGGIMYFEPGTYYIGIHNKLGENNTEWTTTYSFYIRGLNITSSSFVPGPISNLVAKAAEDLSNNIVVTWKNPTVDVAGVSMEGKDITVKIYLNEEETPATTITDGSESCTIAVPTPGVYTIKAVVESGSASSKEMTAKTGWVGSPSVDFPYLTNFNPDEDSAVEIWNNFIIDGNNDGKTFQFDYSSYYNTYRFKMEDYLSDYKDFILSPYLNLAPGIYNVKLVMDCGLYAAPIVIGYCKGGSFNSESYRDAMTILGEESLVDSYDGYKRSYNLEITEEGSYQFVIGEVNSGSSSCSGLILQSFSIVKSLPYPANVTELKVESNPENEQEAIISWINPSKVYGTDATLTNIEEVVIERDGNVIGRISENLQPGEAASFIDKTLPEGGKYTYTVYATLEGVGHGEEYASVASPWIGGGLSMPLNMQADDERWIIVDTHNDIEHYSWYKANAWYYDTDYLWYLHESSSNPADDYLMTPPVKINPNEVYKVTFEATANGQADQKNYVASVKMGLGSDHTVYSEVAKINIPENASTLIAQEYSFYVAVGKGGVTANVNGKVALKAEELTVEEAAQLYKDAVKIQEGSHTVAIHANTDNGGMRIKSFNIEKVADYDISTGIGSVEADGIVIDGNIIYFPGEADVMVYDISGICVASAEKCVESFELPALTSGYYIIKVGDKTFKVVLK